MIVFEEFKVETTEREVLIEITREIREIVMNSNISEGNCRVYVPHTTAGITINENADRSVIKDIANYLNKLIPEGGGLEYRFKHGEGNSDAHIKCLLTGNSINIMVHEGKLILGVWQGCFFTEYDGPRVRKVYVQVQGE